jgi:Cyclin-dependent kinase inhibitor 3 (CDKN3)
MNDKPIPESYWVVPGKFLAGAYPITGRNEAIICKDLAGFLEAGFDTFFDLTRVGELPPYLPELQAEAARHGKPVTYQRINIQDRGLPSIEQMAALLDSIDNALTSGHILYLHCWGGIGRTGMAVGCWLVQHGLTGGQALIRLNEIYRTSKQNRTFPQSPETDAQVKFILDWVVYGLA